MRRKISVKIIVIAVALILILGIPLGIYAVNATKSTPKPEEKFFPVDTKAEYVPDELIVKFAPGYAPDEVYTQVAEREIYAESTMGKAIIARQNAEFALTAQKTPEERQVVLDQLFGELGVISYRPLADTTDPILSRVYVLEFPPGSDLNTIQETLSQSEATSFMQPDYVGELFQVTVPNDPRYQSMWGLEMIGAEDGWQKTTGSDSVVVGVTDTGVDLNHEDLKAHITSGGKNIVDNNNNPQDTHYHGTHVAGTIGAVTNNGIGVAGINWNVKILPVKVCNAQGKCPTSSVASGISYASSNGAKIINLSVGGVPGCTAQSIYQDAINFATSKGTLVVVAAGNSNIDASGVSPASCNGVLTVGAVGPTKARASYSNFGSTVEIAAPGGSGSTVDTGILSTLPDSKYGLLAGTSMATPHVAGVAALLASLDSSLTPSEIVSCIVKGATPISTDKNIGPLLNIPGALQACGFTDDTTPPPPTTPSVSPGSSDITPPVSPNPSITQPPVGGASPTPGTFYVTGVVFHDANRNQKRDSGEVSVPGAQIALKGPVTKSARTSNSGEFIFSDLQRGAYTMTQSYLGVPMWEYNFTISDARPTYNFAIPVFSLGQNSAASPSPTRSTTPVPTARVITPTSTRGKASTSNPTPTPLSYYKCKTVRNTTPTEGRRIGISYLVCEKTSTVTR